MSRPLLGLILGGALGLVDGGTAFFSAPELRSELAGILMGSTMKGLVAGLVTGLITRKTGSLARGALVGVAVAFALAVPIGIMNATHYENAGYFWKIVLPPTLFGVFVGYATVRFGRRPRPDPAR